MRELQVFAGLICGNLPIIINIFLTKRAPGLYRLVFTPKPKGQINIPVIILSIGIYKRIIPRRLPLCFPE
jgi:hypothetical protein